MPTRNVVLTDSQAKFVEQMVASGHYQNASEVLREGLRLVQAREAEQAAKLAALREAVAVGIADIEAGRYTEFNDAASLDASYRQVWCMRHRPVMTDQAASRCRSCSSSFTGSPSLNRTPPMSSAMRSWPRILRQAFSAS